MKAVREVDAGDDDHDGGNNNHHQLKGVNADSFEDVESQRVDYGVSDLWQKRGRAAISARLHATLQVTEYLANNNFSPAI